MTYQPTKIELEELGIEKSGHTSANILILTPGLVLYYIDGIWALSGNNRIHPQSLEDLKTLIRILTPQ